MLATNSQSATSKPKKLRHLTLGVLGFLIIAFSYLSYRNIQSIRAEQNGGSPESGATSRFTTLVTELESRGYGQEGSGSWGDWGLAWNRIYSASVHPFNDAVSKGLSNGGNEDYPKEKGGVDDSNNATSIPADSYQAEWTACNAGNNYCGTGSQVAEKKDENTGLVWSPRISTGTNWFNANNCQYPNGLPGDDGTCNTHNEVACICVKKTSDKTGCEGYDDGNWRLPTQKELMMAYIDGSRAQLTNPAFYYWSSTTYSTTTFTAWYTYQNNGYTINNNKTNNNSVRCVR